ncbi:MAG TPA: hypothetical protein VHZ50_10365 [Puia sp.]|jgi:hypothetical protein|nr:hypothetical protein [Puia sp.]
MDIKNDHLNGAKLNTPILLVVFNRPGPTQRVFDAIKETKPAYLYVAADGPRPGNSADKERCQKVKQIITEGIDWDCEVKTRFQEENLGCGKGVSSAITWFFENVEQGIILEDDCLPDKSFFGFCSELLEKYKDDARVSHISGFNYMSAGNGIANANSYFFSIHAPIWGWASWRRAWKDYDFYMASWELESSKKQIKKRFSFYQMLSIGNAFEAMYNQKIDTWDFQWWYLCILTNTVGIVPNVNLIQNIGFNNDATHTNESDGEISALRPGEMLFPLVHPPQIKINGKYDKLMFNRFHKQKTINIIKIFIKRILIMK